MSVLNYINKKRIPQVKAGLIVPVSDDSGVAWTPSEITTSLWLDADDSDTITESSNLVSQWDDKSGNSNHATQGVGASQPLTNTNTLNSLNVMKFASDVMTFGTSIESVKSALFVANVLDGASIVNTASIIFASIDAENQYTFINVNTTDGVYDISIDGTSSVNSGNASVNGQLSLTSGGNINLGQTNAENESSNVWYADYDTAFSVDKICQNASAGSLTGDIAEIILLPSVPSESDRQKLEGYLAHKWGLTAKLPEAHPYKSTAPTV